MTVMQVNGNQVRIGIAAPDNVSVDREEIRRNKEAGLPPPLKVSIGDRQ